MERLQDKLRQERTNDQPSLNRCDFDIVERYVDSSSDEEGGLPDEQHGGEQQDRTEEQQRHEEQRLRGRGNQTGDPPRVSFPPALHRSLLNLQKDDLQERINLGEIYGALDAPSVATTTNVANLANEGNAAHLTDRGSREDGKSEPNRREKVNHSDVDRKGRKNQVKEKHQLTFQINQNEVAKLQWTNPVRDEEVREMRSFSEVKLHQVRFDFEGKLRIQINETELNKKKKNLQSF
ncbi:hypothetical protein C922_03350 [Plasmodium inui San Antonio 1]|uniref:Uncharacterized protein n=1 Tax=Plasmodium inui San Antonio 1 TaxID=1237626 RepID=W7A3C5_9APIC|nr:hypothetical protein C922_03350 [Plasmodium inui San Antonio 1]EUD66155.1 hypothetical protein C922_03350 [Plasmodium inui San Antonio 1]